MKTKKMNAKTSVLLVGVVCLMGCSDSNNGTSNNGTSNNGGSNNGGSNNGGSNNGNPNNGRSNNGLTNNGTSNNGTTGTNNGTVAQRWLPEYVGINTSWETATGQSGDAINDSSGSQFDLGLGNAGLLTVVDAVAESITPVHGTNVMQMGVDGQSDQYLREFNAFSPEGDCRYTRMYQQVVCIADDISQIHHLEDFPRDTDLTTSTRFVHRAYAYTGGDGRWSVSPQSYADQSTPFDVCPGQVEHGAYGQIGGGLTALVNDGAINPDSHDPQGLECGKWYRIESQECCVEQGSDCWDTPSYDTLVPVIMRLRVWDETGLVQDESNHFSADSGGTYGRRSMEEMYAAGACRIVQSSPVFGVGNNGQMGVSATAEAFMYWDAFVTGSSDDYRVGAEAWIGPCDGPGCF